MMVNVKDLRTPLVYLSLDNTGAVTGPAILQRRALIIGQKTSGNGIDGKLELCPSEQAAKNLWGASSMMHSMIEQFKACNETTELWGISLADGSGSVAATNAKAITITGTATQAGSISLMIAGKKVRVAVINTATAAAIAAELIIKINASELPVSASQGTTHDSDIELTCKWKGETGNDIDIIVNPELTDEIPSGLTLTTVAMTGGNANPDVADAIANMGDEWFTDIVMPFTDKTNLDTLRDELVKRYGPIEMMDAQAYIAFNGTLAESSTFGNTRNDFLYTCIASNKAPQPSYVWAAGYAAICCDSLGIDPARPLQTLSIPGLIPADASVRWDINERNTLLHDGMSTHKVAAGDMVQIERAISMYQTNPAGADDVSYLDITTAATLGYIRYATKNRIQLDFPRHKLANDGTRFDPSQPIVTPQIIRDTLLDLFTQFERLGLVENFEQYKDSLIVERDIQDVNAINITAHPDIINQFRKLYGAIQFKL